MTGTTVVLFDIDGTLVRCGAAPRVALDRAMVATFGSSGSLASVSFGGKTDRIIVREALPQAPPWDAPVWPSFWNRYTAHLTKELLALSMPEVLPGVLELLEALRARPDTILALVTGNVPEGARTKLRHAGLDHYFENGDSALIGAFGDEAISKADLGAIAVRHVEKLFGDRARHFRYVVVGDTPSDVACARAAGLRAVVVATGFTAMKDLEHCEPDALLTRLTPLASTLDAILGGAPLLG